jgi:hypothetical protein
LKKKPTPQETKPVLIPLMKELNAQEKYLEKKITVGRVDMEIMLKKFLTFHFYHFCLVLSK